MELSQKESSQNNLISRKNIVLIVIISLLLILSVLFFIFGGSIIKKTYDKAVEEKKAEYAVMIKNAVYDYAEKENHVSNDVIIQIESIKETAKLEVLKVSSVVYVTEGDENNTAWLEATGSGVYTVDLTAAEFIIDSERQYVLVRVPSPELENIALESTRSIAVEPNNDLKFGVISWLNNGSISEGEALAVKQLKDAHRLLKDDFNKQRYTKAAENSANEQIKALVKSLNMDIDLTVEVELLEAKVKSE